MNKFFTSLFLVLVSVASVSAFAPCTPKFGVPVTRPSISLEQPASLQRQRHSVAQVQTMGLFGLGAPEIGVILVAAAFLLGPEKLAELGKDAGKIAGELKEVPKEFQAGLKEGEAQAAAAKKQIEEKSSSE